MDKVINIINLLGWTYLLVQTEIELVFNREQFVTSDISLSIKILQCIQLLQISDIVLLLMGKTKGSIFAAFFQILGRNIVTLFLIEQDTGRLVYAFVVIVWSIAEVNRYLYYLFKENPITGFLRYNGFLILYPLGGVAQTLVFNDFFNRHPSLPNPTYYFLKFINGCIIIAIVLLYSYMLKARKRYMNSLSKTSSTPQEQTKAHPISKKD